MNRMQAPFCRRTKLDRFLNRGSSLLYASWKFEMARRVKDGFPTFLTSGKFAGCYLGFLRATNCLSVILPKKIKTLLPGGIIKNLAVLGMWIIFALRK